MQDSDCVEFLQWALPRLKRPSPGFRKVRKSANASTDAGKGLACPVRSVTPLFFRTSQKLKGLHAPYAASPNTLILGSL
jgi:hypothetical protein